MDKCYVGRTGQVLVLLLLNALELVLFSIMNGSVPTDTKTFSIRGPGDKLNLNLTITYGFILKQILIIFLQRGIFVIKSTEGSSIHTNGSPRGINKSDAAVALSQRQLACQHAGGGVRGVKTP